MSTAWLQHRLRCAVLVALGLILAVPAAIAGPAPAARRRAPALFSGFLGRMNVNHWDCGLFADGHVCNDPNGSTTVGGGFWPAKPDQYVFGSGTQVAGVIDPSLTGFAWAGDTTAAFFEDPSGSHENGDALSLVWQSNNASDLANWPRDAYVPNDPSLYSTTLIGSKVASQEDVWLRYWDGNTSKNAGRPHPLGVLVDERGMAWNFPSGNEDIQYWIFTITNISAANPKVYAGRPDADSLTSYGRRYQAAVAGTGVTIPDTGYTITSAYFAFAMDADVSVNAKQNFTTAFLPFNMGIAFKSNWYAPEFIYPSTIFSPPFAPTVGEVGVKYLKSPLKNPSNPALGEIGLLLYSGTVNGGAFGDAANAAQVYRYLSGTLSPARGDAPCNYPLGAGQQPKDVHVCYIPTSPDDIRFFESSGPFNLKPGESQTIAVAYIGSAPVDNPAIANRSASFVFPAGGPFPEQPESLATGSQKLTKLDSIFGALTIVGDTGGATGGGPNGKIDQNEITVVPRSLLAKGLVAQAVFDVKFLLPFPPDAPDFYLVPGDNQVTIVWSRSNSESVADPYFAVASDPASKLYDPDYRPLDVQGYRIYRGRTSDNLQPIAQFDYAGKEFIDFTAELQYGNCAPELNLNTAADGCPTDLAAGHHVPIASPFVQIPPGGRVELATGNTATGNVLIIQADTTVTGGGGTGKGFTPLTNEGIPFAFTDRGVKNGFTYFYAVAAFDVNSVKSTGVGFTSLEGRAPLKTMVPRKFSGQEAGGGGVTALVSPRGKALNPGAPLPTLDASTGIFSGPMPPADGLAAGFPVEVGQLITTATVSMQIDSITPGGTGELDFGPGPAAVYYITLQRVASPPIQIQVPVSTDCCDVTQSGTAYGPFVAYANNPKTTRFKGSDTTTFALSAGATVSVPGAWRTANWGRASVFASPANADENGPRWWAGAANENTTSPNSSLCSPASGGCSITDFSKTAGSIAGVTIFHLQAYSTIRSTNGRDLDIIDGSVYRAADFSVYWGNTSGVVDSVIDVTHDAPVPFSTAVRASWGILDTSSFAGVTSDSTLDRNNNLLTWTDVLCVDPYPGFGFQAAAPASTGTSSACHSPPVAGVVPVAHLVSQAHLSPIALASVRDTATHSIAATGDGFIFYLNGHWFLMQMAALPTTGTVWHARFYSGNVTGNAGKSNYAFVPAIRPPAVPGLKAVGSFTGTSFDSTHVSDSLLAKIHTVPDPYYVTNAFEQSPNSKVLRFVNLPSECIIRIYSLSGILVQMIAVNDPTGGGEAQWDLRNRNQQFVASGVYFFHVETPDGKAKIGRFTIVNFAQ